MGSREKVEEIEAETNKDKNEEKEDETTATTTMKPWEQHAGVISIPRYDYKAPSALLSRSYSGFLITCSIKREKSATKEALQFLHKYAGLFGLASTSSSNCQRDKDNVIGKRRKIVGNDDDNSNSIDDALSNLSLVKLNRSGLVLLNFLGNPSSSHITIDILSDIFNSIQHGTLKSPLWCHRIFPVQATCLLNEKELQATVLQLVRQFMNNNQSSLALPVKFAIGYNRRGIEGTVKTAKGVPEDLDVLDRGKCFEVVASSVKIIVSDSVVDLKNPDLSVLVELLPVSGVPSDKLLAAVSVLPQSLVSTKPRLCIKPLLSDNKTNGDGKLKADSQLQNGAN